MVLHKKRTLTRSLVVALSLSRSQHLRTQQKTYKAKLQRQIARTNRSDHFRMNGVRLYTSTDVSDPTRSTPQRKHIEMSTRKTILFCIDILVDLPILSYGTSGIYGFAVSSWKPSSNHHFHSINNACSHVPIICICCESTLND